MRLEAKRAAAQAVFVSAVQRALPAAALKQLCALRGPKNVPRWARKWRINAPCMIEFAVHLRDFAAALSPAERTQLIQGKIRLDCTVAQIPRLKEWAVELKRLDALSSSVLRESLADRVTTDFLGNSRRRQRLNDVTSLAPLSADPLRESLGHFVQRATEHFAARDQRLKEQKTTAGLRPGPIRVSPQLRTHVTWLVRFQLGESYRQIARSEGFHHETGDVTVRKGVTEAAELVALPVRRKGRVGRPVTRGRK